MSDPVRYQILIVDSDPEFRRSLEKSLVRAGYAVSTAPDAIRAHELALKHAYRLILWDGALFTKSGLKELQQLKKESPDSRVILLTVNGDFEAVCEEAEAGVFALLHKPIKRETLLYHTARALDQSRA